MLSPRLILLLPLVCRLAQTASSGGEIINGKKAKKNSLEYMASVQSKEKHMCGGFLITPNFVLTAAHCDKRDLTVVLGAHDIKSENIQRFNVVKKYKHPHFKNLKDGNDIMLLQISKKVELGKNIKKVNIPLKDKAVKPKSKCLVAGWGRNQTRGQVVKDLLVTEVEVLDPQKCQQQWVPTQLPRHIICAGGYETNKGACQGDSGGPLVCSGVAVGIVSFNWNSRCDYPNRPNIYTQISKFLPWIRNITENGY